MAKKNELIVYGYVRQEFEDKFNTEDMPKALKDIVISYTIKFTYYYALTLQQDCALYNFLNPKSGRFWGKAHVGDLKEKLNETDPLEWDELKAIISDLKNRKILFFIDPWLYQWP